MRGSRNVKSSERSKWRLSTCKQRKALNKWEEDNPNWNTSDKGKDDYIKLMKSIMTDISHEENKIIKTIAKETIINK